MSHNASLLLSDPNERVVNCIGAPFLAYRNLRGYEYDHAKLLSSATGIATSATSEKLLRRLSKERAHFFQDHLADFPVPTQLLADTLAEDWLALTERAEEQQLSTLTSIQHGSESLLLHRNGRDLDQISVLNTASFSPESPSESRPGFTMELSKGAPIRHIVRAGSTNCGASPLVLAATRAELFLLQSVSSLELGGEHAKDHLPHVPTQALDLLQRYPLPTSVRHVAAAAASCSSRPLCLGEDGRLYLWSSSRGVVPWSSCSTAWPSASSVTWSAQHPQVCFLCTKQATLLLDLRTSSSPSSSCCCLQGASWSVWSPGDSSSVLVSGERDEVWTDLRCPSRPLHRRDGPGSRLFSCCLEEEKGASGHQEVIAAGGGGGGRRSPTYLHGLATTSPLLPSNLLQTAVGRTGTGGRRWTRQAVQHVPGEEEACTGLALAWGPQRTRTGWLAWQTGRGDLLLQPWTSPSDLTPTETETPTPTPLRGSPSGQVPVPGAAYLPGVGEEALRRHDVLALDPDRLSKGARSRPRPRPRPRGIDTQISRPGSWVRGLLQGWTASLLGEEEGEGRRGRRWWTLAEVVAGLARWSLSHGLGEEGEEELGVGAVLSLLREETSGWEEAAVCLPYRGALSQSVLWGAYGDGAAVEGEAEGEEDNCLLAARLTFSPKLRREQEEEGEGEEEEEVEQAGSHAVGRDLCLLLRDHWALEG